MASEVQAKGDGQQYHGSVLEILTIVLACVSVLVVTVRGVARHRISRIVESTDILLPVALVSDTRLCSLPPLYTQQQDAHHNNINRCLHWHKPRLYAWRSRMASAVMSTRWMQIRYQHSKRYVLLIFLRKRLGIQSWGL